MSEQLIRRRRELSNAITDGREARDREFTMRIPADPERDADLVLNAAADRIEALEKRLENVIEDMRSAARKVNAQLYESIIDRINRGDTLVSPAEPNSGNQCDSEIGADNSLG